MSIPNLKTTDLHSTSTTGTTESTSRLILEKYKASNRPLHGQWGQDTKYCYFMVYLREDCQIKEMTLHKTEYEVINHELIAKIFLVEKESRHQNAIDPPLKQLRTYFFRPVDVSYTIEKDGMYIIQFESASASFYNSILTLILTP